MKRKKKNFWFSRTARTIINLLLTAVLAFFLWGFIGFPLPTLELRFRRAEQANWVGPSQIVSIFQTDETRRIAAVYQDQILLWSDGDSSFWYWPRQDGPAVLPLYDTPLNSEVVWILAVEEPEGAVSARLTARAESWLEITGTAPSSTRWSGVPDPASGEWMRYEKEFTVEADSRVKTGGFLFPIYARTPESGERLSEIDQRLLEQIGQWESYRRPAEWVGAACSLHVDFFDENGAVIGQADLNTPD